MIIFKKYKIKKLTKKIKNLQDARVHSQPSEEASKKEIALYHSLAAINESLIGHKKYPFAAQMRLECFRASGELEDSEGLYILGKALLDEAKFREDLQKQGVFASKSNERQSQSLYEEAHAYLLSAEKLKYIKAKRLRGLAYINGWGVTSDKKMGFDLIVASIDEENSWDKVPQIFAALGLNKPEFYSALTQHRKG